MPADKSDVRMDQLNARLDNIQAMVARLQQNVLTMQQQFREVMREEIRAALIDFANGGNPMASIMDHPSAAIPHHQQQHHAASSLPHPPPPPPPPPPHSQQPHPHQQTRQSSQQLSRNSIALPSAVDSNNPGVGASNANRGASANNNNNNASANSNNRHANNTNNTNATANARSGSGAGNNNPGAASGGPSTNNDNNSTNNSSGANPNNSSSNNGQNNSAAADPVSNVFIMDRSITSSVRDAYNEWYYGRNGMPSVVQFDRLYYTRWRSQNEGNRKWYKRRKKLIQEIDYLIQHGLDENEALNRVQEFMTRNNCKTLHGIQEMITAVRKQNVRIFQALLTPGNHGPHGHAPQQLQ